MKPSNFPAKVQRRRQSALARLAACPTPSHREEGEMQRLQARLVPGASAIRSKKYRGPLRPEDRRPSTVAA